LVQEHAAIKSKLFLSQGDTMTSPTQSESPSEFVQVQSHTPEFATNLNQNDSTVPHSEFTELANSTRKKRTRNIWLCGFGFLAAAVIILFCVRCMWGSKEKKMSSKSQVSAAKIIAKSGADGCGKLTAQSVATSKRRFSKPKYLVPVTVTAVVMLLVGIMVVAVIYKIRQDELQALIAKVKSTTITSGQESTEEVVGVFDSTAGRSIIGLWCGVVVLFVVGGSIGVRVMRSQKDDSTQYDCYQNAIDLCSAVKKDEKLAIYLSRNYLLDDEKCVAVKQNNSNSSVDKYQDDLTYTLCNMVNESSCDSVPIILYISQADGAAESTYEKHSYEIIDIALAESSYRLESKDRWITYKIYSIFKTYMLELSKRMKEMQDIAHLCTEKVLTGEEVIVGHVKKEEEESFDIGVPKVEEVVSLQITAV
jgi:hypothetical protein